MNRNATFWVSLAAFEIVFGLAVFAITRAYYLPDAPPAAARAPSPPPALIWPETLPQASTVPSMSLSGRQTTLQDPAEISRQANEFFANRNYAGAAELYAELLVLDPGNVDTHNNLGLTLHYIGRSDDALRTLRDGVAVDPTYQRIWLTIGFVNSQLGNIDDARAALDTAVQMGPGTEVGRSAARMIESLATPAN